MTFVGWLPVHFARIQIVMIVTSSALLPMQQRRHPGYVGSHDLTLQATFIAVRCFIVDIYKRQARLSGQRRLNTSLILQWQCTTERKSSMTGLPRALLVSALFGWVGLLGAG